MRPRLAFLLGTLISACQLDPRGVSIGDDVSVTQPLCDEELCQNGGVCSDDTDDAACVCPSGWDGPTCEHNLDDCDPNPCENEGTCRDAVDSYTCNCAAGFRGDNCELAFDGCDPNPCLNDGICNEDADGSHCECPEGWDGATCQHNLDDCATNPCRNGATCRDDVASRSCECLLGFDGEDCELTSYATCAAIKAAVPEVPNGVYTVDPDAEGEQPPLEVLCNQTIAGGGWTLVGQEHEGVTGTFKYLGIEAGDAEAVATRDEDGYFGPRFAGQYSEVRIRWWSRNARGGIIQFTPSDELFQNTVRTAMPVSDFSTSDARLRGWVSDAGGAVFCRASESPDVRPGDSSWAVKPSDVPVGNCGCNGMNWSGHGAYYSGHRNATACTSSGGGWAGVADDGEPKSYFTRWSSQIWIR